MPVDPGNLLLLGSAKGRPVLGAPGCARSPKENGFDWVLMRLLAGLPVPREAITGMGVGGLLMEIVTRPQPRAEACAATRSALPPSCSPRAVRRAWAGRTSFWRISAGGPWCALQSRQALASRAHPVIVVTGHQHAEIEKALGGLSGAHRA